MLKLPSNQGKKGNAMSYLTFYLLGKKQVNYSRETNLSGHGALKIIVTRGFCKRDLEQFTGWYSPAKRFYICVRSWVVRNALSSRIGKMESFFLTHTHAQAKPYIFVHTDTPSKGLWNRRTVTREKPQQGCHYSGPFRDARGELPLKLAEQGSQPSSLLTKSQGGLLAISLLQFLPFFLLGSGL